MAGDPGKTKVHCLIREWETEQQLLKLINSSSYLNKGDHNRDGIWISDLNWHRLL